MTYGWRWAVAAQMICVGSAVSCGSDERGPSPRPFDGATAARAVVASIQSIRPASPHRAPSFDVDGSTLRPRISDADARGVVHRAEVTLPAKANGAFHLRDVDSNVAVDVALEGAREVAAEVVDGYVVYRGAHAGGGHIVHRAHAEGTEDYVAFDAPAAEARLRYRVSLGEKVAGLRLVSNVLEFLDAGGAPRLRVAPPWGADASGKRVDAALSVLGCAVDENPKLPWGRVVSDPGSRSCLVVVSWNASARVLVVDPAWTTTGSLVLNRALHSASLLANGRVLVAGGRGDPGNSTWASAEVFDPAAGGSWASSGSMATARSLHTATVLADGRILVVGGETYDSIPMGTYQAAASAEVFDPSSGAWTGAPTMSLGRLGHTASLLADGRVLVAGGGTGQSTNTPFGGTNLAEVLDASFGKWTGTGPMSAARVYHTASVLSDQRVVVTGGAQFTAGAGAVFSSVEVFTPATGSWASGPPMGEARSRHTATVLADGRVVVTGGTGVGSSLKTAEAYAPGAGGAWAALGSMTTARHRSAAVLVGGRVLAVAGLTEPGGPTILSSAESLDPVKAAWAPAGAMVVARADHTATVLADGRVLVVGGSDPPFAQGLVSAEILTLQPAGVACVGGECASGFCVDGVCCDTLCDGVCQSCSAAKKGGGADGVCAFVAAGLNPDKECTSNGSGMCQTPGFCDGQGACQSKAGIPCGAASCVDASTQSNPATCDATGACVPGTTTKPCTPFVCAGAGCKTSCVTASDCVTNAGYSCNAGKCTKAGDVGAACSAPSDCVTGFCADGVCCDTECAGACKACSASMKGYGKDGACADVKLGTDPHDDCPTNLPTSCKNTGQCDGSGGCERYGANTVCGTPSCQSGVVSGTTCDGAGTCGPQAGKQSCGLNGCADATTCATSCEVDTDCATTAHCKAGHCIANLGNGAPCSTGAICESGFCADGVCCGSPCTGQCEACDETPGVCAPVKGIPHGTRQPCETSDPTCKGSCSGGDPTSCGYPGTNTPCGGTCAGASLQPLQCNGAGKCIAGAAIGCAPYACDASAKSCRASCKADGDCASGSKCDMGSGQCAAISTTCKDASTLVTADGKEQTCAPYRCLGGACQQQCGTSADCTAGAACTDGKCASATAASAPGAASSDGGGCGCAVPGRPTRDAGAVAALAFAVTVLRRRRAAVRGHGRGDSRV